MTESEVLAALARHYGKGDEYAFLSHVRDGTGSYGGRTADALVMSLWPSRGLELMGIEVKVSRSDWLREKRDGAKSADIQEFCDRWWIVTDSDKWIWEGELPPTWGWMVVGDRGVSVKVKAPKLKAKQITRIMLAAILRRAVKGMIPESEVKAQVAKGLESARASQNWELVQLRETVQAFEEASGLKIAGRYGFEMRGVAEAVKIVQQAGVKSLPGALLRLVSFAEVVTNEGIKAIERMRADGFEFHESDAYVSQEHFRELVNGKKKRRRQ